MPAAGADGGQQPKNYVEWLCAPTISRRSELVVYAGAHDVVCHVAGRDRDGRGRHHVEVGPVVAEVDVEIFELGGPVRPERPFDATADGPAVGECVGVAE